jgi:hypothetical protein
MSIISEFELTLTATELDTLSLEAGEEFVLFAEAFGADAGSFDPEVNGTLLGIGDVSIDVEGDLNLWVEAWVGEGNLLYWTISLDRGEGSDPILAEGFDLQLAWDSIKP